MFTNESPTLKWKKSVFPFISFSDAKLVSKVCRFHNTSLGIPATKERRAVSCLLCNSRRVIASQKITEAPKPAPCRRGLGPAAARSFCLVLLYLK